MIQSSIYPHLWSKHYEITSRNPHIEGFLIRPKTHFDFPKILTFGFIELSMTNLFNVHSLLSLNTIKSPWCIHIHQGISNGTKIIIGSTMIYEISMWQTKQTKNLFEEIDVKLSILKINLNFKLSHPQIYHKSQINI
jgi:hypothetical protein